jgi:hypothetical protein
MFNYIFTKVNYDKSIMKNIKKKKKNNEFFPPIISTVRNPIKFGL